jgi:hypothetical protein
MWKEAIDVYFEVISRNFLGGTDENHGKRKVRLVGVHFEIRFGHSRIEV